MKKLILFFSLFLASTMPASADTDWFIILGYSYPPEVVGGPYSNISFCSRYAISYEMGYHAHCQYLVHNGEYGKIYNGPPVSPTPTPPRPKPSPTAIPYEVAPKPMVKPYQGH